MVSKGHGATQDVCICTICRPASIYHYRNVPGLLITGIRDYVTENIFLSLLMGGRLGKEARNGSVSDMDKGEDRRSMSRTQVHKGCK